MAEQHLELWVNQVLILESDNGRAYDAQILNIDRDRITINQPVDKGANFLPIEEEQSVIAYYYNERKEMFAFRSVLSRGKENIFMTKPAVDEIRKIQRRNYFRVPATLQVTLCKVADDSNEETCETYLSYDISGGGVTFHCQKQNDFAMDQEVSGTILLDDEQNNSIPFQGTIVGIRPGRTLDTIIAIRFDHLKEADRSAIVRYCLKRQLDIHYKIGHE